MVLPQGGGLMPQVPLVLPTRSNPTRHGYEGNARLINAYVETTGADAKNERAIYPVTGLDTYLTPTVGKVWAMIPTETRLYGVTRQTVWSVDTSDVVTIIGTLDLEGPVTMARNRRSTVQVGLVSADNKYYTIENTTMTLNTDPDLQGPPQAIDVKDGFFIIPTNLNRYFITGEDNATAIAATDFGKAQRSPDEILRVIATETDIALMGANSIEWHQNSPSTTASFPFVPVANIDLGLASAQAVTKLDRLVVWLASDGTVRIMEGYGGQVISTPAVQRAVGAVTDKSTIRMFAWHSRQIGHSFVAMTCPQWTWVYDIQEGSWHERRTYGRPDWRCSAAVEWQGRVLVGDDTTGELFDIGPAYNDEAGEPLVWEVWTAPVDAFPKGAIIHNLTLDVVPGVGDVTSASAAKRDPKILMSYSDDGGRNWSPEREGSLGVGGASNARVQWNRLGLMRRNGRTFRFRCSSSNRTGLLSASIDAEPLA